MSEKITVLTIKQPWAHLICFGGKDIENRKWRTKFRGRLFIHSAKVDDVEALEKYEELGVIKSDDLVRGAIIGSVEVVDCVSESDSPWFDGPNGFVLKNPRPEIVEFCRGKLGLWTYNL